MRRFRHTIRIASLTLLVALLVSPVTRAQRPPSPQPTPSVGGSGSRGATIIVRVREDNGMLLSRMALVSLYSFGGGLVSSTSTQGSQATFRGIGSGRFTVEVAAPGYVTTRTEASVDFSGSTTNVEVTVKAEIDPKSAVTSVPGAPVLAPKAQQEVSKGLEALRTGKLEDARKHLDVAYRLAPGNPDVNYLLGVLASMSGNAHEAQVFWQKTVDMYPQHAFALLALGDALFQQGDLPGAASYLKLAAEANPSSWRSQASLAQVSLRQQSYEDTIRYAENALKLGKEKARDVRFFEAEAQAALGQRERAIATLEAYLVQANIEVQFATPAKRLLEGLRDSAPVPPRAAPAAAPPAPVTPPSAAPSALLLPLPSEWMPPDVDAMVPPVEPGNACPVDGLLQAAGTRVKEILHAVDRFTATENLRHEDIGAGGLPSGMEIRTFDYLVSIEEIRPRILNVEEYRDGSQSMERFPNKLATRGFPSLVLVFHPYYRDNYDMLCEGQTKWRGSSVWQVHFRQRTDKPSQLMTYRIGGVVYPIALKGRAWISASTFQILRMEMDMVSPVPEIRLRAEHIAVDYGPVRFRDRDVELWLPRDVEIFMDFRGRRSHRRHSFSNYMLFSVDDKQSIQAPKMTDAAPAPSQDPSPQPWE
jgi:Tfp pilus assembly protein PilF